MFETTPSLLETGLALGVLFLGLLPLLLSRGMRWPRVLGLGLLLTGTGVAVRAAYTEREIPLADRFADHRPQEMAVDGYLGSDACRSCHPQEHSSWHDSYHRSMTQIITEETVLGDFDDVELHWQGRSYRTERRGDEFWVDIPAFDWTGPGPAPRIVRPVVMSTGSHNQQIYWYRGNNSRVLGQFPFVWVIPEKMWIPRSAAFLMPSPPRPRDETGNWNLGCVECHSTSGRPHVDQAKGTANTSAAELGISCEACHGPGEEHVRANQDPSRRYQLHLSDAGDPTIVNPSRLPAQRSAEVCGQCHSKLGLVGREARREFNEHGFAFRPGQVLKDDRLIVHPDMGEEFPRIKRNLLKQNPSLFEDRFWSDGMMQVGGREYNSLVGSPCYAGEELSCLSCHQMHQGSAEVDPRDTLEWTDDQLHPQREGNAACTQCHEDFLDASHRAAHTHHSAGSSGDQCYNCHMPHTSYGLHKAIRSHLVDSPRVQTTLATGRPNACNQCHLDQSLGWAADHLNEWYGIPRPALDAELEATASTLLWAIRGDARQRALATWCLGWDEAQAVSGSDWMAPVLAQLLADPYDAIRFIAWRSLRRVPGFEDFDYDLLADQTERLRARDRALALWDRLQPASGRPPRRELLLDANGDFLQETFQALLKQRDDRIVNVNE